MVRCDELTERVTDYLARQLSLSQSFEVYLHLRCCKGCRSYLNQMKETVRLLGQLPPPLCSAKVKDELLPRFRRARLRPPPRRRGERTLYLVADGASASARAAVKEGP